MQLYLAGHLNFYAPQKRARVEIHLPAPRRLSEVLRELGIPAGEIFVAAVNGAAVSIDAARVADNDRVDLYPPVGGGACA